MALRVLYVEDSEHQRKGLCEKLSSAGFDCLEAENGYHALEVLVKNTNPPVDLILCDVNMPLMGGFEFVQVLKKESDWKDIPVLMITTEMDHSFKMIGDSLGVCAWAAKTTPVQKLVNAIEKITAKKALEAV